MNICSIALMLTFGMSLVYGQSETVPKDGNEVIRRMYDAYRGRWYKSVVFKQQSVFYRQGQVEREETWFEALKVGGGLLIKFGSKESAGGLLFRNDTMTVFRNDSLISRNRRVHDLLLLGFDVYARDPAVTVEGLREAGYDMARCAIDDSSGTRQYVVGDPAGARFWVDAQTLLFTKLRKKDARGNETEIQFNKYTKVGEGWIAPEVVMMRNGQVTMKELYSEISGDTHLPDKLFGDSPFHGRTWK